MKIGPINKLFKKYKKRCVYFVEGFLFNGYQNEWSRLYLTNEALF